METKLAACPRGKKGCIKSINGGQEVNKRLCEMGFNKGTKIEVVKNDVGPLIVSIYGSKIAIGRGMAQKIFIQSL